MKKQTVKQFFEFLEKKEKTESPFLYKLILSPESLTKEDLIVDDDLMLGDMNIKALPEGLLVMQNLDLENSPIEFLPKKLTVYNSLVLTNAVALKELPGNLTIGRDLWIDQTRIEDVPKNLRVGGSVFVGDSTILAKYGSYGAVKEVILKKGGSVGEDVMGPFTRFS